MHGDRAAGVPGSVHHPGAVAEVQLVAVLQLPVGPGGRRHRQRQPVLVQRDLPVQRHRFGHRRVTAYHRRVEPVGEHLGAEPSGQLTGGAHMGAVAVGEDDTAEPAGLRSQVPPGSSGIQSRLDSA